MLLAIAVVLVGIFFVATGRGGELAYEQADHAPLDLGPVSAADIALLRPPSAMWGYNMQVTDAALDQIARAMRERDVTIAYLQDQLASAQRNGAYAEPRGAHARPLSIASPGQAGLEPAGDPGPLALSEGQAAPAPFEAQEPFDADAPEEPDAPEELADPEPLEPLETATYRQTPLVLKASGAKPPPAPERNEVTQPSVIREPDEEPDDHDPTEPNATLTPQGQEEAREEAGETATDAARGPQGSFDTHDWWAEQTEAAQKERARRQAAGETYLDSEEEAEESGHPGDDPLAAEEQGW
jgi:hypothetical protein